jgi:ribonuclease HIII
MTKNNRPACFTTKVDVSLKDKLKKDLEEQGFSFSKPPYTIFSAKKPGISCSLYESGSLVIQGKNKDDFIEFYIEPEILKKLSYTYANLDVDFTPRIGVDEAGKGDFFGPLCIAGLYADKEGVDKLLSLGIKDSKKISDKKILELAKEIRKFPNSVIRLFPLKYNELYSRFNNLNSLLGWGHATVISDLYAKTRCDKAIIDQFAGKHVVENALKKKQITIDLDQRHKGEEDPVVAGASVLARAGFLEGLESLGKEINFQLPKGASSLVIQAGKKLVEKFGEEILNKVGKKHFKTRKDIFEIIEE